MAWEWTEEQLRDLAARATTLEERWRGHVVPVADPAGQGQARLQQWQQVLVRTDDPELFAQRLAFDGLEADSVRPLLGMVRLRTGEPTPGWAVMLQRLLTGYRRKSEPETD